MTDDPDSDVIKPRKQASRPHDAVEIEVSAGIIARKHFAGPLAGPLLLFLLILHQTKHRSVRWRGGAWHTLESIAGETGRHVNVIRRWLAELEAGGYLTVERAKPGVRITLKRRVWFRGTRAMLTEIIPTISGRDTSEAASAIPTTSGSLSLPLLVASPTTSGRDRPTEAASGADSVIRLSRTSSYEHTSREPDEKSGVKSVADRRAFWSEKLAEAESAGDEPGAAWARRNLAGVERGGFDP